MNSNEQALFLCDRIAAQLPAASRALLSVFDSVTSTNDLLRGRAEQGGQITPMAAVAAADAVEQCCGLPVQIKWVNDLLLHGKKICGILAESKFSASQDPDYVILGIGINLLTPAGGFPKELQEIAGAVFPSGTNADEAFVSCAAALISALLREYRLLPQRHYLSAYKRRLCVLNRQITVSENGIDRAATALAVDDDLRLLVRYADDGSEQWRATGEIRIRL